MNVDMYAFTSDKVVTFVYDHLFFSMPFHINNIYIDNHRTIFIFSFQLPVAIEKLAVILVLDVYEIKSVGIED